MTKSQAEMVEIQNVNIPGRTSRVNSHKYEAMRRALLTLIPKKEPGITQAEMRDLVTPSLPPDLWPGGDKAMWWIKTVQLDLEAKGLLVRTPGTPTRWRRA
ncbi:MAG TPA: hypothetical protein PLL78_09800 [Fimbriimonadaceae bacterium]|nr:hypothetical protein [Fimbriimonadaceae bacterium]HRJ96968.1 hypothetical protein [Fimbriimonadaceae bacterium]